MLVFAYVVVLACAATPFAYVVYRAWKLARYERLVREYRDRLGVR